MQRWPVIRQIAGVVLIVIGIIGILLPIMPGWIFVFAGLALIAPEKGRMWAAKLRSMAPTKYLREESSARSTNKPASAESK